MKVSTCISQKFLFSFSILLINFLLQHFLQNCTVTRGRDLIETKFRELQEAVNFDGVQANVIGSDRATLKMEKETRENPSWLRVFKADEKELMREKSRENFDRNIENGDMTLSLYHNHTINQECCHWNLIFSNSLKCNPGRPK